MFHETGMDWDLAITRNREGLLGTVLGLFAMIGLTIGGAAVERLSRPLYRKVLGRLQAAEAAVRRLIIVMARDIVVEPRPKRPAPKRPVGSRRGQAKDAGEGQSASRPPSFQFCDPQKRSDTGRGRRRRRKGRRPEPRVTVLDYDPRDTWFRFFGQTRPAAPAPQEKTVKDDTVTARSLCRRLFAIIRALNNMEREARRYASWRDKPKEERRPRRERALRFGWPPGWRSRPTHEVHEILKECHWLVRQLPALDTS